MTVSDVSNASDEGLWEFALALYAQPGISELCLEMQDTYGGDVALILYAIWLGQHHHALSQRDFASVNALCAPWRDAILQPLRAQRRRWKSSANVASEYAAAKALELDAERFQLARLEGHAIASGWLAKDIKKRPRGGQELRLQSDNLGVVLNASGLSMSAAKSAIKRLLNAAQALNLR